jgi:putative FmdB family regulatory protein
MPTYEYRCPACGEEFEKFQRMSDDPVADCPGCGKPAERRMSGGAGLLFKGSGFYITDYRSDSYKKAAKSESGGGAEKKSDSAAPASSDTKPGTKSE